MLLNIYTFSETINNIEMPLPTIPRLEKFCFCMDVHTGVKSSSIGLIILWICYALGAIFGTNSSAGHFCMIFSYSQITVCMNECIICVAKL